MSKKPINAINRQKRRKAPIIILVVLIAAAVGAITTFLVLDSYNTPSTLTEKLTRVMHGEPYDEIEQYYKSSDGSDSLGFNWKTQTEDTDSRVVFFENGTGFIKITNKSKSAVDIINGQLSDKGKKTSDKSGDKSKTDSVEQLTDGKTTLLLSKYHREDDKHRMDFNWSINESGKTLSLKVGSKTLVYTFVDNPELDIENDFAGEAASKWALNGKNLAFSGFVYYAPEKATFWSTLQENFNSTFIIENRWQSLLSGLGITLLIALCSTILGLLLGFLLAIIRSTYDMTLKDQYCYKPGEYALKVLNFIANLYITIIRGTPVVVQLMIMYFIIFASWDNGIVAAILAFGINSGAYVAEIVRSGIMSIDKGQFEASRSLGFDYKHTMVFVILPQALKNVLPALGNEFIVLLKETSVAGYVAIVDLTKASDIIRSRTYEPFFPLITIAIIYLILVLILSFFLKRLERRLRNSDH